MNNGKRPDTLPSALDALEASMAREAEKDAKIEEQAKRIQFLEDHILRITPEYKKSRDKLLDECDRLTAERDAEKRRADNAEHYPVVPQCEGCIYATIESGRLRAEREASFANNTDAPTGAESEKME